uniref:Uncharacterized protein n=2 Tax=Lotharella globosa TaxID=91324 RepID=A0A7S3YYM8_9EUKA
MCANDTKHRYGGMCENPEVFSSNLVLSRVKIEVDTRRFGDYGKCNICVNSTIPMTKPPEPCVDGTYHCVCGDFNHPRPCGIRVGREDINSTFGENTPTSNYSSEWWWTWNLVTRTGGQWYSTPEQGEGLTWRLVETMKKIDAKCHDKKFDGMVYLMEKDCFDACPQPRNRTDFCSINCTFNALLGEEAGHARSSSGLSGDEIVDLWVEAFEECPSIE